MSGRTAYEVQGYTGGEWRTLRVCGDPDSAVTDAKSLRDNRKYLGIRVRAEMFNETSSAFASRVIYRYSRLTPEQKVPAGHARRPTSSLEIPQRPTYNRSMYNARADQFSDSESLAGMLVWRLGLVALVGLSLLLAIQHFI